MYRQRTAPIRKLQDAAAASPQADKEYYRRPHLPAPKLQDKGGLLYENMTPGTDYLYFAENDRVKGNIVICERSSICRYGFMLETEGLKMRFHEEERTLTFSSLENGRDVFVIPAHFMTDAAESYSDDVYYEVHPVTNTRSTLTILPDSTWLCADERVFPITH